MGRPIGRDTCGRDGLVVDLVGTPWRSAWLPIDRPGCQEP
jgi:hypothetical protein